MQIRLEPVAMTGAGNPNHSWSTNRMTFPTRALRIAFILIPIIFNHLSASAPEKYSLGKCIEVGLVNNFNLIRSEHALMTAGSRKFQALGVFTPSVNASASWNRSDREQVRIRNNQLFNSRDNFSASVQANLDLFDGFANIATVDQAIINQRGAQQDLARTKQDVVFQIQAQFYNVLRYKQLLSVSNENLKRSRKQLERIQEFNRVGTVPLADVYRQQVQVGRDELSAIQAESDVRNAIADLALLVGIKPTDEFDIEEPAVDAQVDSTVISEFRKEVGDYEAVVKRALENRADYQSAMEAKNSSEKSVTIARAGYFPSLSAFASYGWSDPELKEFFNDINAKDYFSYGLQLSLPILSNFRTTTGVEQAVIAQKTAEENVDQLTRQIAVEIRKALNQLETAEKNIDISRRNLTASREDLRIAEERYAIGAGTLLDQIVANTSYIAAQSDNVNSIYNYLVARKQVEYSIGKRAF